MLKYYVADAFAEEVFEGNPAGVCVLDEWLPAQLMSKIAVENNLSETAFCVKTDGKTDDSKAAYELRWFTPGGEIDLCGHATFGTAYILFRFYEQRAEEIHFETLKAGHHLVVKKKGDILEMDFPAMEFREFEYADYMTEALGARPDEVYCTDRDMLFVYNDAKTVAEMQPDFRKLTEFPHGLSAYVTAITDDEEFDYVARAFWPKININEDPVCGSMYCTLIPFWAERLGKDEQVARQVSPRGGTVHGTYCGDYVKIAGKGVLYAEGHILVDEE